ISGTPASQRALNFDSQRVSAMSSIKYSVDSYYQDNRQLPKSLDQLNASYLNLNDPETGKAYEYKVMNDTNYSLCTTFSTDTKDPSSQNRQYSYTNIGGTTAYHSKGYDCLNLKAPVIYTPPTPSAYKPNPSNTNTFYGTVDSIAKSSSPRMIIKDNTSQMVRIFNIEGAEIINKSGETISYESFQPGDKVIIDSPMSGGYTAYQANRIQNLSR
ncbi:MAG TPA: hypothetical protein VI230_02190, partial [Ignavibacteriaceae bacterium]